MACKCVKPQKKEIKIAGEKVDVCAKSLGGCGREIKRPASPPGGSVPVFLGSKDSAKLHETAKEIRAVLGSSKKAPVSRGKSAPKHIREYLAKGSFSWGAGPVFMNTRGEPGALGSSGKNSERDANESVSHFLRRFDPLFFHFLKESRSREAFLKNVEARLSAGELREILESGPRGRYVERAIDSGKSEVFYWSMVSREWRRFLSEDKQ